MHIDSQHHNLIWIIWHLQFSFDQQINMQLVQQSKRTNRWEDIGFYWPKYISLCKRLWVMHTHKPWQSWRQNTPWLSKEIVYTTQTEININRTSQTGPGLTLSSSSSPSDISLDQNITRKCLSHTPASQYYALSWTALSCQALKPGC